MEIRRATLADLPVLATLFDRYRQFYGQPADADRARRFLAERLEREESVVFMAFEARRALGFVQLYPGFSSVGAARTFVLNDLYVEADQRGRGTGRGLVAAATAHARSTGAASLSLQTGVANDAAQRLYESLGWIRETRFLGYGLSLVPASVVEG
jgi:ribosomal protein S18 acetylase RimI-like enzyme